MKWWPILSVLIRTFVAALDAVLVPPPTNGGGNPHPKPKEPR